MRLAVISDIHGNLAALELVLADLEASGGADLTWCLGDLAAFGPRPAECIRRVKALAEADEGKKFKVIGGNTDRYMVNGERPRFPSAKDADGLKQMIAEWRNLNAGLLWGVEQLSFDDYEFLKKIRGQELSQDVEGYGHIIGYHAIPGNDETNLTPETPDEEARDFLLDREGRLAFGGHIHRQFDKEVRGWRVVNVGSVGMPFDAKGQASWALVTFEGGQATVDLRRVPYDVEAVITDMEVVGFPVVEWSAKRLRA
ncbi:MAG: metallophosphoesterase family protein [Anaerolineae bacterium]